MCATQESRPGTQSHNGCREEVEGQLLGPVSGPCRSCLTVFVPGEGGARELFALAAAERVQVRHLRPSVPTLEDVFAHAVGEE